MLSISQDPELHTAITEGYKMDNWCQKLQAAAPGMLSIQKQGDLLFIGECLVVPSSGNICESLFWLAHNSLGHFRFEKSYGALCNSYYWLTMQKDLEAMYIPSCTNCQRNKSKTTKPAGPLHPLPIPDQCGDSVTMDFIGPLPEDNGYNCILTMTD